MKGEIENKLERLRKYVKKLESNSDVTVEELEKNEMKRAAFERFFHMAIETVLDEIEEIKEREDMPEAEKNKVCRKCAYYEFCWV